MSDHGSHATGHDAGHAAPETGSVESNLPNLHVDRYEAAWIRISVIVLVIFTIFVALSGFAWGIQLPGVYQRIDPATLNDAGSPFAEPGLRELAPGKYEAYMTAQVWSFSPSEIRIPVGSEVTFYVTSRDVQHGFKIMETNVNMMVLPGQISTLKATFEEAGTYNLICHEYCGAGGPTIGHHTMYAQIFVEGGEAAEEAVAAQ
ncbi:MAG: cytochrome c oxidase subunit II [Caldilineaceae bacterium]|nr:cytochrome c oxidase subunit II [Caldilineaceae bacterium]